MTRQFRAHKPLDKSGVARQAESAPAPPAKTEAAAEATRGPKEIGGPAGPEPTRYGDWERKGICVDF